MDGQPVILPLHCTHCLQPVRVQYRRELRDRQSECRCPYCGEMQIFTLRGSVVRVDRADDRV
jgi:DNA-directed RNA polymerase subunit RPC12/RpoP